MQKNIFRISIISVFEEQFTQNVHQKNMEILDYELTMDYIFSWKSRQKLILLKKPPFLILIFRILIIVEIVSLRNGVNHLIVMRLVQMMDPIHKGIICVIHLTCTDITKNRKKL